MPVERTQGGTSLIDVLDRVLDKGIVIDAWVRVSLVGIDLITVEARVVVASIDTYIKYSEAVGQVVPGSRPAIDSRTHDALLAENAALRAQIAAQAAPSDDVVIQRPRASAAMPSSRSGSVTPAFACPSLTSSTVAPDSRAARRASCSPRR